MAGLALAILTGCTPALGPAPVAPAQRPVDVAAPVPQTVSPASAAARAHYARVQAQLLSQGLLRTDGGGPDTPFTDRMLAENFIRIALYDEYARTAGGPVQRMTQSRIRKWEAPVRVGLRFGASTPPDRRAADTARVASFLQRLSRVTGHPIALDDNAPNFFIQIVSEDERRALGPQIRAALPGLSESEVAAITDMPRSTYCLVYAMSSGNGATYTRAFAVIRSEHPDLLRLSCLHEEIAQGLGLANDSPSARPSIFNDDEEFALLTRQDELMLKMLYNPALRPGMDETQARPIVESLAARLTGGEG
ncbi:DUF2927 domain-containing protein [Rhodobacteraceae bacterium HSP-20]|uniref:DUF2927 domain-containing protein n=1 Tax=Paragemmobacter amnigenus TaxID=2852097 RepID=A0ABS6J0Y3_9RHOB|nr:DUF2927 domain-containing protein [Rhodobacter amnigenus]MBV4388641.1 DUF2927 domain-containing protein [Rhodobacter amnigenus]